MLSDTVALSFSFTCMPVSNPCGSLLCLFGVTKQKTQRLSKLLARRLYSRSSIEGVTRLAAEAALLLF